MIYKIEKGIAIPSNVKACKYPFAKMKVGDSFTLPMVYKKASTVNIVGAARRWCVTNKKNWKFLSRKHKNKVRIWRIK